ncbi:MAG TPA: DUF1801 domain-containing protein [Candidatus Saccharimonadales bacterium]|nr:DUF1801 domain-containing protein [Candidatus Saccharimonadales bacterium]
MTTIQEYLDACTPAQKAEYGRIKTIVKVHAPNVEEVISYGIPTFKVDGKPLLYFGAFKDHMSVFPASDAMVKTVGKGLEKFRVSKGTLHFTDKNKIPDDILNDIVKFRLRNL